MTREVTLKRRIKDAAGDPTNSSRHLRHVFDDTCRDDPSAASVGFNAIESSMRRKRRRDTPPLPQTFEDINLTGTIYDKYFISNISYETGRGIVFGNRQLADGLAECTNTYFDGTFFVAPDLFLQLFTVSVDYMGNVFPILFCIMTHKTKGLYKELFRVMKDLFPQMHLSKGMSDFESASRFALQEIYPTITLSGCFFHFTQAIFKQIQKLSLRDTYKSNPLLAGFCKRLMALAMLPTQSITPAFNNLTSEILDISREDRRNLDKLLSYFRRYWLQTVKPENFSVFHVRRQTNNHIESYHRKLKSRIRVHKPNLFHFISHLNNLIDDYSLDMERLSRGLEVTRKQKRKNAANERKILALKGRLQNGDCTEEQFLRAASHAFSVDTDYVDEANLPDFINEASSDEEGEDGLGGPEVPAEPNPVQPDPAPPTAANPPEAGRCIICLGPRGSTYCFIPCGHANICGDCKDNYEATGLRTCPTCRGDFAAIIRIHN